MEFHLTEFGVAAASKSKSATWTSESEQTPKIVEIQLSQELF
jgi:hypothetical protein